MDWFSRYVLAWRLSNSLEATFCVNALEEALGAQGACEIFNSDQGCQFTSDEFIKLLREREIKISMDGKGRCFDNIFIERLWRSVKYEEIYLKCYREKTMLEANGGIQNYFGLYNNERHHQSLGYKTPAAVYFKKGTKNAE